MRWEERSCLDWSHKHINVLKFYSTRLFFILFSPITNRCVTLFLNRNLLFDNPWQASDYVALFSYSLQINLKIIKISSKKHMSNKIIYSIDVNRLEKSSSSSSLSLAFLLSFDSCSCSANNLIQLTESWGNQVLNCSSFLLSSLLLLLRRRLFMSMNNRFIHTFPEYGIFALSVVLRVQYDLNVLCIHTCKHS